MILLTIILILILAHLQGWIEYFIVKYQKEDKPKRKLLRNLRDELIVLLLYGLLSYERQDLRVLWAILPTIPLYDLIFGMTLGILLHGKADYLGNKGWDKIIKETFHGGITWIFVRLFAFGMFVKLFKYLKK